MKYLQTFRLHPTPQQTDKMRQRFALAGYAYNWGLQETERVWEAEHRHLSFFDIVELYRHHANYDLRRTYSRDEHEALCHLDHAYGEYFAHRAQKPREKQPEDMVSLTVRADNPDTPQPDYKNQTVHIPNIGRVRCTFYRHVQGQPTTLTVKEARPGVFHIIYLTEAEERQPVGGKPEVVGIDLGLKTFATLSDGTHIDFPEHIWGRRATRRERHLQRCLSRCQKGSKRWQRAKQRLARFYEHRANQRKDFHCKEAARLTSKYQAIAVEDLHVEGMMDKHRHMSNRDFSHYGLRQFLRRLEARCQRTGTQFLQINRYAPTSKTCHVCGYRRRSLDTKIREWTCPKCGTLLDRDLNAAINIKTLGQRLQQTLPDASGEVTTVEQPERHSSEAVKAEGRPSAAMPTQEHLPAPSPQGDKEQGRSRLALQSNQARNITASDFLKLMKPVLLTRRLSEITDVSVKQLENARRTLSVHWRRQMMAEKCEALRLQLLDILQNKVPPLLKVQPQEYAQRFTDELTGWLKFKQICRDEKGLTLPVTPANALLWHLYLQRVIRNLQNIKVIE